MSNFLPAAATKNVVAGAGGADRITLDALPATNRVVRVFNGGTVTAFVKFGLSTVTVSATDGLPVAGGTYQDLVAIGATTHIAAVAPAGTPTIYTTEGYSMT